MMIQLLDVLTAQQAQEAYEIGLRRSSAGRNRGGRHRYGWQPTPEQQRDTDGQSAVAERMVAAVFDRRWISDGIVPDRQQDGDVEGGISVRWTVRRNGSLIVHEDEPDNLTAALVVGEMPLMVFCGTIPVGDAKQARWWRTDVRYPAYFVPQSALTNPSIVDHHVELSQLSFFDLTA